MKDLKEAARLALEALETLMLERGSVYDKAITALRTALEQPAQDEPVLWLLEGKVEASDLPEDYTGCLYTRPQAREWVGLTDEQIETLWQNTSPYYDHNDFARAIEAKLREKNT